MSLHSQFLDIIRLQTDTFVHHVELHDSLPSTNDRALVLASDGTLKTPALVIARKQTAGRGRGDHKWWSADGALTFSLILDTRQFGITQRDWPRMSLLTAVAICDGLTTPCSIKWPNDVLADGRKIAGILIESPAAAGGKDRVIVGVGINVNNSLSSSSSEVRASGISLQEVASVTCDLEQTLIRFLGAFEQRLAQLVTADPALPLTWQKLSSLTDQDVVVEANCHSRIARCLGIASDGGLLLKTRDGTSQIYSGSIRLAEAKPRQA